MELTLLGTGCPKVDYKRFGPSNLITSNKTNTATANNEVTSRGRISRLKKITVSNITDININ